MYDTARAALKALTDDNLLERVAVKVLRIRHPELRITGPSSDLNRDAFGRPLFGERDEIVLLVSCEDPWTSKIRRDLGEYRAYPADKRPEKAVFVTTRSTKQTTQDGYKKQALAELGIALEVVDLNELALDLESDALYRVAEVDLGVRPREPRVLQPVAVFRERQELAQSGFGAPLVGREAETRELRNTLALARQSGGARIVVIEGPAGVGKTRMAVDVSHAAATTLVAAPGTKVTAGALADVPLDEPSVVVVDDAHRSSDLSGLAAMFADPRFDSVTVVLTVAAGSSGGVLARWVLDRERAVTASLGGLSRQEIGQIVVGRGFPGQAFRSHVAAVAQGSPWLAHEACLIAAEQEVFSWRNTAELLKQLADRRLGQAGVDTDEHRAAAVALALMTTVNEGRQLAVLAGAVTALPSDEHRLDVLLEDLAQAGITSGPPFSVSPAVAAPALVAAALDPHARVRVRLGPAMRALGRDVMLATEDAAPENEGVLGLRAVRTTGDRATVIDAGRLAARLSVLAQAARQRDDPGLAGTLRQAVQELLPDGADITAWLDVLTVAAPVAAAAPQLAAGLRDALTRNWPPAAAARPWDDDPGGWYRFDVERLVEQAIVIGKQASCGDFNRAVAWVLECAWLSEPVLGAGSIRLAGRGIRSLLRIRVRSGAQTWDDVLTERREVLDAVLRWGAERCDGPPAGLPAADRGTRDPAVAARVLLAAVTPLMTLVAEEHGFGTPEDGRVFTWGHHALPDDPRAAAILTAAADAAAALLGRLDPQSPAAGPVMQAITGLPREIRAEAARGLGESQPLPGYAVAAMNDAAAWIGESVASRWGRLPLAVRYAAAESATRPGGRPGRPLAELAADGDPVAASAVSDPELEQLLIVLPFIQPRYRQASADKVSQQAEAVRGRARDLAARLPASEAVDLLTLIDAETASSDQYDCLAAFARAAGRNAPDPQPVLGRLREGTFTASVPLFSGLLQAWPQECFAWLMTNIATRRVAELGLWVADELPPDQETALLDAVADQLTKVSGPGGTGSGQHAGTDTLGPGHEHATGPNPGVAALTARLADHLGWCRARPADRLNRLMAMSSATPGGVPGRILAAMDTILHSPSGAHELDGEDGSGLRQGLAGFLAHALAAADGTVGGHADHDTAAAAESLGRAAPAETAQVLIDRVLGETPIVIPYAWERLFLDQRPEEREPLATAYQALIEPHLVSGSLPAHAETAALDALDVLGQGLPNWVALIREWAAGNATSRTRAANAIRHRWRDPIWRKIVPELLDKGISEYATANLREGIVPVTDVTDVTDIEDRKDALQPLLDDPRPVVRRFAEEAIQALQPILSLFKSRIAGLK